MSRPGRPGQRRSIEALPDEKAVGIEGVLGVGAGWEVRGDGAGEGVILVFTEAWAEATSLGESTLSSSKNPRLCMELKEITCIFSYIGTLHAISKKKERPWKHESF